MRRAAAVALMGSARILKTAASIVSLLFRAICVDGVFNEKNQKPEHRLQETA
jgi:hypothetical protein